MLRISCGICFDCCLCNLVLYVTVEILVKNKSMVKQTNKNTACENWCTTSKNNRF